MNKLLGCVLFLCSLSASAKDYVSMDVPLDQDNFVVALDANPSTGYEWTLVQFDQGFLTLTGTEYQKPGTNLIGSSGQMLYTFTLNKGKQYPAKTVMTFKYARSWDPSSTTLKKIDVHFVKPV